MTEETTAELRERLLGDEEVREVIARRAYEIYEGRGGEPGHETEDWGQAENEILPLLIEEESRRAGESSGVGTPFNDESDATERPEGRKAAG